MQRDALFDLLAQSPASIFVVTPNRRLARALSADFDRYQAKRSQSVWETPQILPFAAFVGRLYDGAQHDPAITGVRTPLTPMQERALWQEVVGDSDLGLLSSAAAAELAADTWTLAHQWSVFSRVQRYTSVADTRVFLAWAREYQRRVNTADGIDMARLPDIVRGYIESGTIKPRPHLVLAGFDETTPQQQQLFDACVAHGSFCQRFETGRHEAMPLRAACLNERDEYEKMADWIATRLAAEPKARIGVVVPQLASRRRALAAALDAALVPDQALAPTGARPYSISLGGALADVALVAFYLRAIRLAFDSVEFAEASALLRSPYFAGAAHERDARDLLDARLRRRCQRSVGFEALYDAVQVCARDYGVDVGRLLAGLRALSQWRREHAARSRRPSEWATAFAQAVQSISSAIDGDRALDSHEYQALVRWQELLAEFAALDRTPGRLTAHAAISKLERSARETIYQPEGGTPPVQVLGVLEANGLTFDHLWIIGLTADAWPPPAKANPLLPIELQRAAGMPGASAAVELARARRQLERLLQSAGEAIVSHATHDADRKLGPSPLIAAFDAWLPTARATRLIDLIKPAPLVSWSDAVAPPWRPIAALRGGVGILQNQAACPFRAFAVHRLAASAIEPPHDGFDYRERGQLVHDTLAAFWTSMPQPTRATLAAMPEQRRRELLSDAAHAAQERLQRRRSKLSPAMIELESARLVRVIDQWLRHEIADRPEFRVAAIEEARTMHVGPLTISSRLDRVDETSNSARIIIDYKTGATKYAGWLDERPEEPQLLLYLTASEPSAQAIAFGRVRIGDVGLTGLAADPDLLPGRSNQWKGQHASWSVLVAYWSHVLERLAMQFAAGQAAVDPKRLPQTCRYCELPTLCRINERGGAVIAGAVDEDDATPWVSDEE